MGTNIPSYIIYYLPINPTLNINGDIYDLKTKSSKFFYNRLISLKMKYLSLERLQKDISITDIGVCGWQPSQQDVSQLSGYFLKAFPPKAHFKILFGVIFTTETNY